MSTPIILICGGAGSGKDTVGQFLATYGKGVCVAQADPMKRLAREVFGFTDEQLWGPSESRNAPDSRFNDSRAYEEASHRLMNVGLPWLSDVLPGMNQEARLDAWRALREWFVLVRQERGGAGRQPLTARYVLQTLGTEWGRNFSANMWNDYALRVADKLLAGGHVYTRQSGLSVVQKNVATPNKILAEQLAGANFVIVTDGRFRNEILGVKRQGGLVINVTSPTESNTAVEKAGVAGHQSEAELKAIPRHFFDLVVVNDKRQGLLALENLVAGIIRDVSRPKIYSTTPGGEWALD